MLITPHFITGVLVGETLGAHSKPLALAASFSSHFILDAIPHWNPKYPKRLITFDTAVLIIDAVICFLSMILISMKRGYWNWFDLGCGILAILPDIIGIWEMHPHPKWFDLYMAFDTKLQNHVALLPGLASQIALVILVLFLLYGHG